MDKIYRKIAVPLAFAAVAAMSVSCQQQTEQPRRVTKEELIKFNNKLMTRDSTYIVYYSDSLGLNTTPTSTGLWITTHEQGEGKTIEAGQTVELKYTISDLRGHTFYTSEKDGPKRFKAGMGYEVGGLDEALLMLKPNAKATLILIPDKAYGIIGDENKIVGRQILRYDIEIVNVQ